MFRLAIAICLMTGIGCSKQKTAPTITARTDFDSGLKLKWPNAPDESTHDIGDMTHYMASAVERFPDGLLYYSLFIIVHPDDKFGGLTPQQMLDAYTKGFGEITRKHIEHGPKKYPAVEFTRKSETKWDRGIVVMAGRRLHHIIVSASRNEKLLDRPEVKAFFDSFEIKE